MAVLKREDMSPSTNINAHDVHTILGPESTFEGKLTFKGAVHIAGNFNGEIRTNDRLVVGQGARVEATMEVGSIVINGEVIGDVTAKQGVEIHKPGKLRGTVVTPQLMIENGVIFEGTCRMQDAVSNKGGNVTLLKDDAEKKG